MKVRSSYGEGTFHGTKKKDAQSRAARTTETPGTFIGPGGRTMTDSPTDALSMPVDLAGASGFGRTRARLTDTTYATH